VLTSVARDLLEGSGLIGYSFRPVDKKLIVELHWEDWDLNAPEPRDYPESGEPEDYILGKTHCPEAAVALGDLWEVLVPKNVRVLRPRPIVDSWRELTIDSSTWDGADIFGSEDVGCVFFTERARNCFLGPFEKYVDFEEFNSA
jgi:hypothetical protein